MSVSEGDKSVPDLEKMALFMDELPSNPSDNPDIAALQSILYDDQTPEEIAENFKEKGNECVKKGKRQYANALKFYDQAIEQNSGNAVQNSVYHSNKAHVNLLLGNNRRSLTDSEEAVRLNPKNVKALYRATKAAFGLGCFEKAGQHCAAGLAEDPSNTELQQLRGKIDKRLAEAEAQSRRAFEARSKAEALARALDARALRVGRSLYGDKVGTRQPWLDASGLLHWPVLMLYPEVMSTDLVEDFCETDMFSIHINQMFAPEVPPLPWDDKHEYTRSSVVLYYQTNTVRPFRKERMADVLLQGTVSAAEVRPSRDDIDDASASGGDQHADEEGPDWSASGEKRWVKVVRKSSLAKVLSQPGHVIPTIPVFSLLAEGSSFQALFLSGEWSPP